MRKIYTIAKALNICVKSLSINPVATYIDKNYHHYTVPDSEDIVLLGMLEEDPNLILPSNVVELRKNMLYEDTDSLYVKVGSGLLRVLATKDSFKVVYHPCSDIEVSFFTLEMLLRMYAPMYGLVFTHTAGFILNNKLTVINAFGGVGKTEVMMSALNRGAKFIADDFAIMNEFGQIFPYPKMIYLCEYPYDDSLLEKLNRNKLLWRVYNYCKDRNGFFSKRVAARLESQYFGIKVDYLFVSKEETELKFYNIDHFYWVDSSDETVFKKIEFEALYNKMMLCLDIESRRYFDYDGYFRLKYPFFNIYKCLQGKIISSVLDNNTFRGVNIRERNFEELAKLLFCNN